MRKLLYLTVTGLIFIPSLSLAENIVVSIDSSGQAAGGSSPKFNRATGRYVVFNTGSALIPEDTNGALDIYVYDRDFDNNGVYDESSTGSTKLARVSLSKTLGETNGISNFPSISASGRFITFSSEANNIINNDSNGLDDVFLVDRDPDNNGNFYDVAQTVKRVSQRKKNDGTTVESDGSSTYSSVSDDGKRVAFQSQATNLLGGLTDTSDFDVFLWRDESTKPTVEVVSFDHSVGGNKTTSNGTSQAPRISADGSKIVYLSNSTNITALTSGMVTALSPDHFYLYDTASSSNVMVDVTPSGQLSSNPTNEPDSIMYPDISGNGNLVVFPSKSSDLVAGDPTDTIRDIYLRDYSLVSSGVTRKVTQNFEMTNANGDSRSPRISLDGRYIIFETLATTLVPGVGGNFTILLYDRDRDNNGIFDETTFAGFNVHEKVIYRAHPVPVSSSPNDHVTVGDIVNRGGGLANIAFFSFANNLSDLDTNIAADAFVTSAKLHAPILNGCSTIAPGTNSMRIWIDNASPVDPTEGLFIRGELPDIPVGAQVFIRYSTAINAPLAVGSSGCYQVMSSPDFNSGYLFSFINPPSKKFDIGPYFLPPEFQASGLKVGIQLYVPIPPIPPEGHWSSGFHFEFAQ